LRLSQTAIESGGSVTIEVDISNEGMVSGEEIAFLFIRDPVASVARPLLELRGATRISLAPGKTGTVRFELACEDMAFPDEEGVRTLERGVIEILVGPKADRKVLLKQTLRIISSRPD
jgi:beta-glucosidase